MVTLTSQQTLASLDADKMSFTTLAPHARVVAFPETGVHAIKGRPPTRGGTVYDQFHKRQVTIHDNDASTKKFTKSHQEMFDMKMQLKYGSPLVSECFAWGHQMEWSTTMRPQGLEKGIIKAGKRPPPTTAKVEGFNVWAALPQKGHH